MPELAEVEFIRKRWDPGLRQKVLRVGLHGEKRVFRGADLDLLRDGLAGATLLGSEARAKQMLFRFSRGLWLGIHLGMTGELRVEPPKFEPGKHDHLALFQKKQTLVFQDPRQFGRVRIAEGDEPPDWWTSLPPEVVSEGWTKDRLHAFLQRRKRLAIKAALLDQTAFPGIGNWMADEILWRIRFHPKRPCGRLTQHQIDELWRDCREVCRIVLATTGVDYSDPPDDWFFHQRWSNHGECPRDGSPLKTATVGGRTTRWCLKCQR
ncbi:MAG TPA: DNA-formamidopyrimidine glycosylase family protein [Chthoniobacteraceae bacterium]|jgi:formamidopyrimidine-DNA glycosylase